MRSDEIPSPAWQYGRRDDVKGIVHIERPRPPWRQEKRLTECKRDATKVTTIARTEFVAKLAELGAQRASLSTCMTCWETARRWPTWEQDPARCLGRETGGSAYGADSPPVLSAELRALAALAETHREEFEAYLAGLEQTVDLEDLRRRKTRRVRNGLS